ncbi:glycogen debranching enzyme [Synechococcus sp. PCC 7502]|uniref:amylo-alpha-1,6-glucosidase n=1 Tax=Synechococcus sp. PCC 7502 TaxID=1173263 RepID=UPI00029F80E0|nr:amylo-alpha-1,6-glucosidase [Synechococcus sp. PCC 7502]AFY74408.1 glycogen debranching enzyme [Synechococcus sp. PCC 7502]
MPDLTQPVIAQSNESNTIEINGRTFIPVDKTLVTPWNCLIGEHPISTLTLKDDDLFLITDTLGNISDLSCRIGGIEDSMGLFCRDTRFLSRLELQIDGRSPISFSSSAHKGFSMSVLCSNPEINNPNINLGSDENLGQIKAETIGIHREIVIKGGLFEEIQVTNYNTNPVVFAFSLSFDADFLDLFEVKGAKREKRGILLNYLPNQEQLLTQVLSKEIVLAYEGLDGVLMESRIQFNSHQPDEIHGYTAVWRLNLGARESITLGYRIHLFTNNHPTSVVSVPQTFLQAKAEELLEEKIWTEQITKIQTDNKSLNQVIDRAVLDIYLLRQTSEKHNFLSAGVPWFSTLFGRDSIIAASQTLVLDPAIARETLSILAHFQGKEDNEWRDEQRGKILHEIRLGEMARCHEVPHTPYYGTVDATPLWLMLYAEYYAWTADDTILDSLWANAISAMAWIDRNCQETGYLSYYRHSKRGLLNQGWKDSENCIINRKGEIAEGAIALCEVQGYVYAAKIRMSELAERKQLFELAELWRSQAKDLKLRFNQDFWVTDQDYCALALDGEGKPVDSITSNPGHCLNLGIFEHEKALKVAARLNAPDMFNGWGIRTLSSLSPAYNPMGYHIGSVWPHDNSLIALGMRSHSLVKQSLRIAQGLIDMTIGQPYQRPPELFCGYEHDGFSSPVQYPVACSPQAWATGTIFQLISIMVNLVPNAPGNQLRIIDPTLLNSINRLSIQNLRIGQTLLDLEFERSGDTTACRVNKKRGSIRVIIEA